MPRAISWRQFVKKFKQLGFTGPFAGGKHLFMTKGSLKIRIPNPHHNDISAPLVREILGQAGISPHDWDNA